MTQKALLVDIPNAPGPASASPESSPLEGSPLFADHLDGQEAVDHIIISRVMPIREGSLGKIEAESTEDDVFQLFGGGKYRLQARDANSKPIKGGFRTLDLAGDPKFTSETSRALWRRMTALPETTAAPAGTPAGTPPLSLQEIIALTSGADERRREDYDRRVADQERAHQREIERLRAEAEVRQRERAEDEERRRKEGEDREERRRKEAEETRQRDREFQAMMLQIANTAGAGKADPITVLLQGFQLGQQVGGGGEPGDPISALVGNLPQILDRASALLPGRGPAAAPAANPSGQPQIVLQGKIAQKATAVVEHLKAQGADPEIAMDRAFDALLAMKRQTAPTAPSAAARRARFARKPAGAAAPPEPEPAEGG